MTKYKVGSTVTGNVTGIEKYGAFVSLDDYYSGLIHISEISDGFVKDINDSKSMREKLIVSGFLGIVLFQQLYNISMTIGLVPIMGITLPFISYGGSSLISFMILIGIIISLGKKYEKQYKINYY